jgi:hypothetical protein
MAIGRSPVSLGDLISLGLLSPGEEIRLRGRDDQAATVSKDGHLHLGDQVFTSLTTAANRTQGGSSNGWVAWKAFRDDKWIPLARLRDQALERRS